MLLNLLPHELVEKIAFHLPTQDQYTGLVVCKSWYMPFCRMLYRHIRLTSRTQLKQFLNTTQRCGHFVRSVHISDDPIFHMEDCVTGAIPLLRIKVGVTSHELFLLTTQLSRLTSLHFDPRLWQFINTDKVNLSGLHVVPPLNHPRQLRLLHQGQIRTLHLRGADVFDLHKEDQFLPILKGLSTVTDLTLDGDDMWDSEHVMQFTQKHMDELHACLPHLSRLNITDAVHLLSIDPVDNIQPTQLKELTLFASVESADSWCSYLGKKYPLLTHLHIKLSARNHIPSHQQSFTRMLLEFRQLKSLKIHPVMSRQFLNDQSFDKVSSTLKTLELGLWQPQALNTFKPQLQKAITYLMIPNYQSSMDLSVFQNLARLEIKCSHDKTSQSVTSVAIDTILNACPMLSHLEVHWGSIALSQPYTQGLQHPLQTLRLNHACVSDAHVFTYISSACPRFEGLFLRECQGITQVNMPHTQFKYLVLSESSTDHLTLTKYQTRRKQETVRWYTSYRDKYTFRTCIARLSKAPVSSISVHCHTVDQLFFNGCKI